MFDRNSPLTEKFFRPGALAITAGLASLAVFVGGCGEANEILGTNSPEQTEPATGEAKPKTIKQIGEMLRERGLGVTTFRGEKIIAVSGKDAAQIAKQVKTSEGKAQILEGSEMVIVAGSKVNSDTAKQALVAAELLKGQGIYYLETFFKNSELGRANVEVVDVNTLKINIIKTRGQWPDEEKDEANKVYDKIIEISEGIESIGKKINDAFDFNFTIDRSDNGSIKTVTVRTSLESLG